MLCTGALHPARVRVWLGEQPAAVPTSQRKTKHQHPVSEPDQSCCDSCLLFALQSCYHRLVYVVTHSSFDSLSANCLFVRKGLSSPRPAYPLVRFRWPVNMYIVSRGCWLGINAVRTTQTSYLQPVWWRSWNRTYSGTVPARHPAHCFPRQESHEQKFPASARRQLTRSRSAPLALNATRIGHESAFDPRRMPE